jgi:hypothetical protein
MMGRIHRLDGDARRGCIYYKIIVIFFQFGKEIEKGGEFLVQFSSVQEHKNSSSCPEINR